MTSRGLPPGEKRRIQTANDNGNLAALVGLLDHNYPTSEQDPIPNWAFSEAVRLKQYLIFGRLLERFRMQIRIAPAPLYVDTTESWLPDEIRRKPQLKRFCIAYLLIADGQLELAAKLHEINTISIASLLERVLLASNNKEAGQENACAFLVRCINTAHEPEVMMSLYSQFVLTVPPPPLTPRAAEILAPHYSALKTELQGLERQIPANENMERRLATFLQCVAKAYVRMRMLPPEKSYA